MALRDSFWLMRCGVESCATRVTKTFFGVASRGSFTPIRSVAMRPYETNRVRNFLSKTLIVFRHTHKYILSPRKNPKFYCWALCVLSSSLPLPASNADGVPGVVSSAVLFDRFDLWTMTPQSGYCAASAGKSTPLHSETITERRFIGRIWAKPAFVKPGHRSSFSDLSRYSRQINTKD